MQETDTPTNVGSNAGLGLVPCALCGGGSGYTLDEGSTFRWWSVKCATCGQEVAEVRSANPAETTARTARADHGWNAAGAHAEGLRADIEGLRRALEIERRHVSRAE